jgi:hypothetical protein
MYGKYAATCPSEMAMAYDTKKVTTVRQPSDIGIQLRSGRHMLKKRRQQL